MIRVCIHCGDEYDDLSRKGKPGRITECESCHDESTTRLTGNMIYDHKTGAALQINSDPGLTQYIIKATKLQNKGSNLGNNLKVSYQTKGENRCVATVGSSNAKGKKT